MDNNHHHDIPPAGLGGTYQDWLRQRSLCNEQLRLTNERSKPVQTERRKLVSRQRRCTACIVDRASLPTRTRGKQKPATYKQQLSRALQAGGLLYQLPPF
jgi:hypothetical protein